ncbi:MAG: agmatine deiminase family protein [Streptosporangiaceae bacterium]
MPAEWEPHQCCFMAWPCRPDLWGELFEQAKRDYAAIARAIADFEPVVMICRPGDAAAVRAYCGAAGRSPTCWECAATGPRSCWKAGRSTPTGRVRC